MEKQKKNNNRPKATELSFASYYNNAFQYLEYLKNLQIKKYQNTIKQNQQPPVTPQEIENSYHIMYELIGEILDPYYTTDEHLLSLFKKEKSLEDMIDVLKQPQKPTQEEFKKIVSTINDIEDFPNLKKTHTDGFFLFNNHKIDHDHFNVFIQNNVLKNFKIALNNIQSCLKTEVQDIDNRKLVLHDFTYSTLPPNITFPEIIDYFKKITIKYNIMPQKHLQHLDELQKKITALENKTKQEEEKILNLIEQKKQLEDKIKQQNEQILQQNQTNQSLVEEKKNNKQTIDQLIRDQSNINGNISKPAKYTAVATGLASIGTGSVGIAGLFKDFMPDIAVKTCIILAVVYILIAIIAICFIKTKKKPEDIEKDIIIDDNNVYYKIQRNNVNKNPTTNRTDVNSQNQQNKIKILQ